MNRESAKIQNIYLTLLAMQTLAASLIWGINTLFLLDAGLSVFQAFAVNGFFTVSMVLFDIPTGVLADGYGRRLSYLLGAATLVISTLLYLALWKIHAAFYFWAAASMLIGLGFTFFSGANEAWLVDALTETGFFAENQSLEVVFGKGQIVAGVSMLIGSVSGGYIAQATNLGCPYLLRAFLLLGSFALAYFTMFDRGFSPNKTTSVVMSMKIILNTSIDVGLRDRKLRWIMLTSPFFNGVLMYVFYSMQPYLLSIYGDSKAYGVAGLAAAISACAQIIGGASVKLFSRRMQQGLKLIFRATLAGSLLLLAMGLFHGFYLVLALLAGWSLLFAMATPARRSYLNRRIQSHQRATLLSLDSVLGSGGSAVTQPFFGKIAASEGYPISYIYSALFQALALPFIMLAAKEDEKTPLAPTSDQSLPIDDRS